MPGFLKRLSAGLERATQHLSLALVPVVFALMDTNKIQAIAAFDGGHVGFKLGLPLSVITIWQFVSVPNTGVAVNTGLPIELLPLAVVTVPVLLVVQSALAAGYFGSIRNALDGNPHQFVENAGRYFMPFLVLTVVPVLALLPLALGIFGLGALGGSLGGAALLVVLPALIVFLVVAYLFYATPYLVVLRDAGVVDAARRSYVLATQGGPYAAYAAGFALFVLAVSPVATGLVVNLPLVGLPLGILVGGFLGLGANVATMRFVADLDSGSSVAASWETAPSGTAA